MQRQPGSLRSCCTIEAKGSPNTAAPSIEPVCSLRHASPGESPWPRPSGLPRSPPPGPSNAPPPLACVCASPDAPSLALLSASPSPAPAPRTPSGSRGGSAATRCMPPRTRRAALSTAIASATARESRSSGSSASHDPPPRSVCTVAQAPLHARGSRRHHACVPAYGPRGGVASTRLAPFLPAPSLAGSTRVAHSTRTTGPASAIARPERTRIICALPPLQPARLPEHPHQNTHNIVQDAFPGHLLRFDAHRQMQGAAALPVRQSHEPAAADPLEGITPRRALATTRSQPSRRCHNVAPAVISSSRAGSPSCTRRSTGRRPADQTPDTRYYGGCNVAENTMPRRAAAVAAAVLLVACGCVVPGGARMQHTTNRLQVAARVAACARQSRSQASTASALRPRSGARQPRVTGSSGARAPPRPSGTPLTVILRVHCTLLQAGVHLSGYGLYAGLLPAIWATSSALPPPRTLAQPPQPLLMPCARTRRRRA